MSNEQNPLTAEVALNTVAKTISANEVIPDRHYVEKGEALSAMRKYSAQLSLEIEHLKFVNRCKNDHIDWYKQENRIIKGKLNQQIRTTNTIDVGLDLAVELRSLSLQENERLKQTISDLREENDMLRHSLVNAHTEIDTKQHLIRKLKNNEADKFFPELHRLDTAWKDLHNRACAERDEFMLKYDKLEPEAAAYKNALKQIVTEVTFSPPGIYYNGTGAHSFEAITDRAARANNLKIVPYPPKSAVWVHYEPEEKSEG